MGRKKRRGAAVVFLLRPRVRRREDPAAHQRANFKCTHDRCNKRLMTAPGMAIHMLTVHKIKVEKVPNAIEGRDNPEWLIEGMNGIPEGFDFENNRALVDPKAENVVVTGKRPNLGEHAPRERSEDGARRRRSGWGCGRRCDRRARWHAGHAPAGFLRR